MKTLKFNFIVFSFICVMTVTAQQTQQKIEMHIDNIGDTKIKISMNMNAMEWQNWISSTGNNPAALKREMERAMPAYILDDFKLEKDDMNRSFELTLNAYGTCKIDKRGNWILETDQKNAQLTKLTEHKYMLVSSPPEFGGKIQQTFMVEFPSDAKDIKTDTDAYGQSIFKFKMNTPSTPFDLMRWSGLFFIVVGGAWAGKVFLKK